MGYYTIFVSNRALSGNYIALAIGPFVVMAYRGRGGGKPQKSTQSPDRQYKAPREYTKPQQSIQSPDRFYKATKC